MKDLILHIDGKEFKARFPDSNPNIVINDNPYSVDLMKQIDERVFSFSVNNRICHIELDINLYGDSKIVYEGMEFDIKITDETKQLLEKYIKQSSSAVAKGIDQVKAPMPGMVVKIMVEEGDEVKKGDKVAIVEAMKMENALQAPGAGVVHSIKSREGEPVEKEAVILEIKGEE